VVTTLNADPITRRVPAGNLLAKAISCALALAVLPTALPWIHYLGSDPQRLILNFHLAFNVLLAAIFLPFVAPLGRVVDHWLPANHSRTAGSAAPSRSDRSCDASAGDRQRRRANRFASPTWCRKWWLDWSRVLRTNDFQLAEALRKRERRDRSALHGDQAFT